MSETSLLALLVVVGLGTYALRFSFIARPDLSERFDTLARALRFVPVTVLPAIALIAIVSHADTPGLSLFNHRLWAAAVAVAVARLNGGILATVAAGMASLWAFDYWF